MQPRMLLGPRLRGNRDASVARGFALSVMSGLTVAVIVAWVGTIPLGNVNDAVDARGREAIGYLEVHAAVSFDADGERVAAGQLELTAVEHLGMPSGQASIFAFPLTTGTSSSTCELSAILTVLDPYGTEIGEQETDHQQVAAGETTTWSWGNVHVFESGKHTLWLTFRAWGGALCPFAKDGTVVSQSAHAVQFDGLDDE